MPRHTPTDDRGNPCAIAGVSGRQLGLRWVNAQKLAGDDDSVREYQITSRVEDAAAIGAGIIGWIVWQAVLDPVLKPHVIAPVRVGLILLAAFASALVAWLIAMRWARRRRFAQISEIYLGTGRCASCKYALTDLSPSDDGCVVCPECAAAWRSGRIGADGAAHAQPPDDPPGG